MLLADILPKLKEQLAGKYDENEIRQLYYLLIENYLGLTRLDSLLKTDIEITNDIIFKLDNAIERLAKYEPIQYIIGEVEFFDTKFKIRSGVLIPRPETEELVDWIISSHTFVNSNTKIIDLGSGSGCIAISLAKHLKNSEIYAIDNDPVAIEVIKENVVLNQTEIQIVYADVLNNASLNFTTGFIDIIVSNPPYVLESDKKYMQKNVLLFEPENALFVPDDDPLKYYSAIITSSKKVLKKGGYIYFEIHEKKGSEMIDLLKSNKFTEIMLKKDIYGKDRMIRARYEA